MNRQIVEETQKVIAGYTPTKCKRIAAELEAIWLKVTPKRTELLSREAKENLKPQNIPNDVLIAIGNEIGKASGNKIDVFLPLIVLLWNEYGPEWRMVAASALGPMGMRK
jgi:hypothetical protein